MMIFIKPLINGKAIRIISGFFTLLVLSLFIFSLFQRPPDIDDAWLGEHAYWQSKLGYVKSDLMYGITLQEVRFLCHHKLLTLQGAFFISVFGFSLNTIRIIPIIYLLVFFLIYYIYSYKKILSPQIFWVSIILLFSNALIFQYSFVFRPEIPLMTLGLISYIFIEKALQQNNHRILFLVLGGFFAGLCIATHLNGVIFPIAGFILLLTNKRFLQSLIFGLSGIPATLFYFYDFTEQYGFRFWLYQLNETPSHDRISNLPYGLQYLSNLANEHMRFFHSPVEISISILLLFCMTLLYRYMKSYKNLIIYTTLLIFFLALLSVHKSAKYIIVYLPYLILLISISLTNLFDKSKRLSYFKGRMSIARLRQISIVLVMIYLCINILSGVKIAFNKYDAVSDMELIHTYIKEPTVSQNILVPMNFFFLTAGHFNSIHSELSYSEMQKRNPGIYKDGFFQLAALQNIKYIILSEPYIRKFGIDKMSVTDIEKNNYSYVLRENSIIILKQSARLSLKADSF